MGKLIFNINSAYAEFERDIIRDRVIAGTKAKREKIDQWGRRNIASDIQAQIRELIKQGVSIRKDWYNAQHCQRNSTKVYEVSCG